MRRNSRIKDISKFLIYLGLWLQSTCSNHSIPFDSVKFVHTDVTNWASQISAFKVAIDHSPSKSIDTVVAAAGLNGHVTLVPSDEAPSLDRDPPEPSSKTIDANLTGVLYTTQLAWHYFQLKGSPESPDQSKKSIVLISSLAGYMELPGLADYQASKFGVRGIFKSLRTTLGRMGVRINLVAPWFVSTPMTKDIVPKLVEKGVPLAKMETAAEAVVRCAADDSIHGKPSI